MTVLLYSR